MTLKHAQAELKTKQAEVKKMDSGYKKDQDMLQAVRSSREKLEADLTKLNYEGTACVSCFYIQEAFSARNVVATACLCLFRCRWEGRKSVGKKTAAFQRGRST